MEHSEHLVPTKPVGHGQLPKSRAPQVTSREKRIVEICVLFHDSTLSYSENTCSEKKNFSETFVFSTMSLILKKKKKNLSSSF